VARCKNRMRSRRVIFLIFSVRGGWVLIDSLLATVASQKLQSAYYWVCNRSITLGNICCRWGGWLFIVSNRCITEVAIGILLSLQPVNYTIYICLQVGGGLIDSLLATVASQKLQSTYYWVCNRSITLETFVAGAVAFSVTLLFLQSVNCRSCNYNHSRSL
jgi:hypothetical protein